MGIQSELLQGLFLDWRVVSVPSLPSPHLTTPKLSGPESVEEGRGQEGFKVAHYSPPQLSEPGAVLSSHSPREIGIQNEPLPKRLPQCARPHPHYSIALGAKTDSSQGLLQSALLRLSCLLQPVSWLCSLRLCFGPSPFPPPPRPHLGTTPGSGPSGGRAQWVQVGAPAKSTGLAGFSLHTGDAWAVWTVNGGCLSVALRPGTAPHPGKQRKGALRPEARS